MNRQEFLEILRKFQDGRASEKEIQMVEKWYEEMNKRTNDLLFLANSLQQIFK